jgi:small-conductance mechanosensitive channel
MVRNRAELDVANTVSNVTRYAVVSLGALIALSIFGVDLGALAWIGGGLSVGLGFGLAGSSSATSSAASCSSSSASCAPATSSTCKGCAAAVTRVAMRATVLKTADNSEIFVPNKELMTKPVQAMTYSDRTTRVALDISRRPRQRPGAGGKACCWKRCSATRSSCPNPRPACCSPTSTPYSMNFLTFGYVREFGDASRVKSELYQMVRDAFALHKIAVPLPRQDITVVTTATASGQRAALPEQHVAPTR